MDLWAQCAVSFRDNTFEAALIWRHYAQSPCNSLERNDGSRRQFRRIISCLYWEIGALLQNLIIIHA